MNKIDFSELDVGFITQEPLWGSFLEALQEFYTEQVRNPIGELQDIRNMKASTPLIFIKQSLMDMGINIPPDMIVNPERLYDSVYMIPLLHRVLGLESAYRAISYVLGRRVTVYDLYTEDYANFYEQPFGALRVDGGTWYKTTHINLEMQKVGADSNIRLPSNTTLKDRFLSAFFTLAPINIVIDQFYFSIEIENREDFNLQGVVYRHPVRRLICDAAYRLDDAIFTIQGDDTVENNGTAYYTLMANNQPFETDTWTATNLQNVSIKNGSFTFSGFEQETQVQISATAHGQLVTKTVTVQMGLQDVRLLEIVGPDSIVSSSSGDYSVVAHHSGGSTVISADITVTSPYATMSGHTLLPRNLVENQTVGLYCKAVIGGITYSANKLVNLRYLDPNAYLIALTISGEDRLKEGSAHQMYATAFFSDGSSTDVLALWKSSSPVAVVENGLVSTKLVEGETDVTISASYGFRNIVVTADHEAVIYPEFLQLSYIQVYGPTTVYELEKATYACLAVLSDGSSVKVVPEWTTSQFSIGLNGVLNTGIVKEDLPVVISAKYQGIIQNFPIVVKRPEVSLQALIVDGVSTIREGGIATYKAYAQYTNGTVLEINPQWSLAQDYDWATFIGGELLIDSPEESTLSIVAKYPVGTQTYMQAKTVVCTSASNNITGLMITGAESVNAWERIILTATAVYEDGSFAAVNPTWEIYTDDTNAEFLAADIAGYGVVTGRNVDTDTKVIVRATYFQETAEYPITVRYVAQKGPDVPVSSRIIGNAVMYSTQVGSFSQAILFKQCTSELLVSSDWSVDNTNVVVDENGFVTCKVNTDFTFIITAVWSCGGYTVTDSLLVSVVALDLAFTGLGIIGPDTIQIGVNETYTAEVYTDATGNELGSGQIVTPEWTILSDMLNMQLLSNGRIRLSGPVVNQNITLSAMYAFDNNSIETTKTIRVLGSGPVYSTGNALDVDLSTLFSKSIMIIENAFRDDFVGYGFMCVPAVFGTVKFYDVSTGQEAGWCGVNGGVQPTVHRQTQNGVEVVWYVYRTILPNTGSKSYRIDFA